MTVEQEMVVPRSQPELAGRAMSYSSSTTIDRTGVASLRAKGRPNAARASLVANRHLYDSARSVSWGLLRQGVSIRPAKIDDLCVRLESSAEQVCMGLQFAAKRKIG